MSEQRLNGLQVAAGGVEHALAGSVPGLVHPLARALALGDDARRGQAGVPPVMQVKIVSHFWAWLKCRNCTPWRAPLRMPTFKSKRKAR